MLQVERDDKGRIIAIRRGSKEEGAEPLSLVDPEVQTFLRDGGDPNALTGLLEHTDSGVIRVLEDLIDLLIAKQLILFTELPAEAQEKLRQRKQLRSRLGDQGLMVDDIL